MLSSQEVIEQIFYAEGQVSVDFSSLVNRGFLVTTDMNSVILHDRDYGGGPPRELDGGYDNCMLV